MNKYIYDGSLPKSSPLTFLKRNLDVIGFVAFVALLGWAYITLGV